MGIKSTDNTHTTIFMLTLHYYLSSRQHCKCIGRKCAFYRWLSNKNTPQALTSFLWSRDSLKLQFSLCHLNTMQNSLFRLRPALDNLLNEISFPPQKSFKDLQRTYFQIQLLKSRGIVGGNPLPNQVDWIIAERCPSWQYNPFSCSA